MPDADRQVAALEAANLAAVLTCISTCEGTGGPLGYRALFGYRESRGSPIFASFDDHPRIRTYETHDEFVRNGRADYTTAAGRYQITETTFDALNRRFPGLWRGFYPEDQDGMCAALLDGRGALLDAKAGRLNEVVRKCGREWASLPTASGPQGRRTLDFAQNAFLSAGGMLA